MRTILARLMGLLLIAGCSSSITAPSPARSTAELERRFEALRKEYHVPGMSAIVDGPNGTLWERSFGFANVERRDTVTPSTLFHLASLTKPFAAVIALQLHQEGLLDLNAPASQYGIQIDATDTVRIWHLMSHTSEVMPPGSVYRYSGNRYGMIDAALRKVSGKTLAQLFEDRIGNVLALNSTAPNPRATGAYASIGKDPGAVITRLAQGYQFAGTPAPVAYESYFGSAAGLVSTPRDLVRFSRALDEGLLVSGASRSRMWTAIRTPSGRDLPYGIGWFVQQYHGELVVWHYGLWTGASALIVKVPARRLTFVLLGNSPGLSQPFPLGNGDLTTSPFAALFLSSFVDSNALSQGGVH